MRQTVCGLLIVLFLVVMAALRWGPWLMSEGLFSEYRFDRKGKTATVHRDGDIFADVENIEIDNRYGKVRIEATDGTPGWSWDLTCWADTVQLAELFTEHTEMRVDQQSNRSCWRLDLPRPNRQLRGVESNLTLMVPASVEVKLRNRHGDTEIVGVQGGTVAHCQHGKLQLSDLAGNIDAETAHAPLSAERIAGGKLVNRHGPITARNVGGDLETMTSHGKVDVTRVEGALKVHNQHGQVAASGISGPVEIEAHYTEVQLHDLDGSTRVRNHHGKISGKRLRGNLDVQTDYDTIELDVNCAEVVCKNRHGRIELHLADPNLRLVRAETSYADLELSVSESLSPKIEAQNRYGSVKSDFPVYTMDANTDNFQGLDESVPRITLKNEHGNIRVVKSAESDAG